MLSGEVAKKYGNDGLPEDTIEIDFTGTAGQSFGAFLSKGITFYLQGQANDYVGKGLCGGRIVVNPDKSIKYDPAENIIIGNTCFYGATSGQAFIHGIAGERFGVRNSGAEVVVEGVGDHGCEYMTGGRMIVLGKTGRNFAAGMSGGIAYIWNPEKKFEKLVNGEMVDLDALQEENEIQYVHSMIQSHFNLTKSNRAKHLLDNWSQEVKNFIKVIPRDYKKALEKQKEESLHSNGKKVGAATHG
jgi:glutamate synthase domain-containing protein 3